MHIRPTRLSRPAVVLLLGLWCTANADVATNGPHRGFEIDPVRVDYFYEPGCPACAKVELQVINPLRERYAGLHALHRHDTRVKTNYVALVRLQETLQFNVNQSVIIFVDQAHPFAGWPAIRDGVLERVDRSVGERLNPETAPRESTSDRSEVALSDEQLLRGRLRRFTGLGVAGAGLIDGINPCAISTLVFLVSVLNGLKVGRKRMLAVGLVFCGASLATYTAIGFGLLNAFHALESFGAVQRWFETVILILLFTLAALSFSDARRYHRSRCEKDVAVRLPARLKQRINRTIRGRLLARSALPGAMAAGVVVTALESVCTGQVYVPTLVLIVKAGYTGTRVLAYLALYNTMFILPLTIVVGLSYAGLTLQELLTWSRREVVVAKCLMGMLFLAMAALLLCLNT
jgi:hypothetical protein